MKSIRTKLLVFMLLFILIPLVITGYFSTNIAESILKNKINDSNQAALSVLNKYINSFKQNTEDSVKFQ
ncbi:chemotaxis protein [Thermoanaerobacter wiegelii]|uniref:chemotaxis protein n=1 Tax=Thermoanaerobacter wiegelii TaxID=46354 RepID=UPI0001E50079|nr:chemotaxis protein [Thermoanaerobacter wiegelii]